MSQIAKAIVLVGVFVVPFLVLLVTNELFFPYITGKNFAFRIIVEIMAAAWLILALHDPQYRPRFSWIMAAFAGLLLVMFFANAFGAYPHKSFWSNFERMDGYVTLVHVFFYTFVTASVMRSRLLWIRLLHTTLGVAVFLSLYALVQSFQAVDAGGGNWRIDGTLGNSTYMAVYLLFHIFLAALAASAVWRSSFRYYYLALIPFFTILLVQTGTRGAVVGLMVGITLTAGYLAFTASDLRMRRAARASVLSLLLIAGVFFMLRDTAVMQSDPRLARIADISLEAGKTRFVLWSVAWEGVMERPLLGWGQENFNYVFNTYYRPSLYGQEPWFDRVHNVVLDWLVAGGFIGAFFYFGIFGALVYYLIVLPRRNESINSISSIERAILLGLLAAYLTHNLFVFDNLISYIFFALVLAYVHMRVSASSPPLLSSWRIAPVYSPLIASVVGMLLLGTIYTVNIPSVRAAADIINAFAASTIPDRLTAFNTALSRNSFADQEIREQLIISTIGLFEIEGLQDTARQAIYAQTEPIVKTHQASKPNDARVHAFAAMFYRAAGNRDAERAALSRARELSPQKQQFIFEEAFSDIAAGNYEEARALLRMAYELDTTVDDARTYYAIAALYTNDDVLFSELLENPEHWEAFANNAMSFRAAYGTQRFVLMQDIARFRVDRNPQDPTERMNLAFSYYVAGDTSMAVNIIEEAIQEIPAFGAEGRQFIGALENGTLPR